MAEVQPADPGARRLAFVLLVIAFLGGALLLWGLDAGRPAVAHWLKEDPATTTRKARLLLMGLAVLMAGPPVAAGVYLWRFGDRIVNSARFPPPRTRMVQDTVVVTGVDARRRGRVAQGLGGVLVVAGLVLLVLLWRLAP